MSKRHVTSALLSPMPKVSGPTTSYRVVRTFPSMSERTLCEYCRKIIIDYRSGDNRAIRFEFGRHDYYPGLPALTKSAQDGCEVCRLFKVGIEAYFRREIPRLNPDVSEWGGDFSITTLCFFLENSTLNNQVEESVNGPFQLVLEINGPQIRLPWIPFDVFAEEGMIIFLNIV
jgi:hypothetical protein